jgi:dual specificity MAP kinase phosphatase
MNFSAITDELIIGSMPEARDYDTLRDLGVRLVINMRFDRGPELDPGDPPLDFLWLRTFDNPLLLIPLHTLQKGVRMALETIRAGGRVYTHCQHGRHRGVAMGAAVLIALGHSPEQAIRLIKERRPVADPDIFYIRNRIHRFARAYQAGD